MSLAAKYVLFSVALAALVYGPLAMLYRRGEFAETQSELAASIGELSEEQMLGCRANGRDYRIQEQWKPIVGYYAWLLCVMGEPPLPHQLPHEGLIIRLLVIPSNDPPVMIRAQSFPFVPMAYAVELAASGSSVAWATEREISIDHWNSLVASLHEVGFWDLPRPMSNVGLDGSIWVLEATNNNQYHVVERWSGGEVEPAGRILTEMFDIQGF